MSQQTASLLPLDEELYLRSLTGRLVGENLFDGFRKIAVITYPDRICSAMASTAITSFSFFTGYRDGIGRVYVYDEKNLDSIARAVVEGGFEAVYIAYGGEQKMSVVAQAAQKTLDALRRAGFSGALLIHVRTWLATKQLSLVLADENIAGWLERLPEIRVFTADLGAGKFLFHRVKIDGRKAVLSLYREALLTREHIDLLKRSIPPPE